VTPNLASAHASLTLREVYFHCHGIFTVTDLSANEVDEIERHSLASRVFDQGYSMAWNHKSFNEMLVGDEVGKLNNVLAALEEWATIAQDKLKKQRESPRDDMTDDQSMYYDMYLENQDSMLLEILRTFYGALAVSVTASVENTAKMLCDEYRLTLPNGADWSQKRAALEPKSGKFDTIQGFDKATRARLLGNCFKHNESRTNDKWVKAYGGEEGEAMYFIDEKWDEIIKGVESFLMGLVKALP
jgi:hypothetical protein